MSEPGTTDASDTSTAAREVWRLIEPIHTVTYFSPESHQAIGACGFKGFWMGYFAARSAPLGPVGPGPVEATFYNFAPDRVRRALPDAWTYATPQAAMDARLAGAEQALTRAVADRSPGADDAAALAPVVDVLERCAEAASPDGRPLFAAQRSAPRPERLIGRLWQAATSLREHRGDGHVAALVTLGIAGRESHVLAAARRGKTEAGFYSSFRDYSDEEWRDRQADLRSRGIVDGEGLLTGEGQSLVQHLEDVTDLRAAPAYASLTADELGAIREVLSPITAAAKPEAAG